MRKLVLAVLAGSCLIAGPARADDEPLFLRIRPNDDVAVAARARALREEVWARSDRRARIAIASVCTGCLKPLAAPSPAGGAEPDIATTGSISNPPSAPATAGDP
ncbi:hypothetical protein [Methylobacterium haplocladii]|uniref:hypothetical protein n=1 Tax=Methylobacterium haplocladii TaxID=1176176 RepID=UPI001478BF57|nr:hypothetical protein [Methylobacterium haplocladii]